MRCVADVAELFDDCMLPASLLACGRSNRIRANHRTQRLAATLSQHPWNKVHTCRSRSSSPRCGRRSSGAAPSGRCVPTCSPRSSPRSTRRCVYTSAAAPMHSREPLSHAARARGQDDARPALSYENLLLNELVREYLEVRPRSHCFHLHSAHRACTSCCRLAVQQAPAFFERLHVGCGRPSAPYRHPAPPSKHSLTRACSCDRRVRPAGRAPPQAAPLAAAAAPAGAGLGRRPLRRRQPRHVRSSRSARALLPLLAALAYTLTADDRLAATAGRCSTRCWSRRSGRPRRLSQRRRPGCRLVVRRAGPMQPPASSRLDWRGERSTPRFPSASRRDNEEVTMGGPIVGGGKVNSDACV